MNRALDESVKPAVDPGALVTSLPQAERALQPPRPTVTFGVDDEAEVRAAIRKAVPADTFTPASWRYAWFGVLQAVLWGGLALILFAGLPWWANLLLGVVVGHTFGAQGFLAHEVMHGALGGPTWLRQVVAWLGFGPFLVTPGFWHRWHNNAHHGHTNDHDRDPDNFGTVRRYEKNPAAAKFLALAPGSGTWFSAVFFTYSFMFHAQVVLWLQTKHRREFDGFNRPLALVQVLACAALWGALAWASGALAVFTVLVPLLVANTLVQSYILTNHFLRPIAVSNNPVDNSMSLRVPAWLDRLHFRFSHHVEHHLFPAMPMHRAPRVRAWLRANLPRRYVCPPQTLAVSLLYRTPRVYADPVTLVDLKNPARRVDLLALHEELLAASK